MLQVHVFGIKYYHEYLEDKIYHRHLDLIWLLQTNK